MSQSLNVMKRVNAVNKGEIMVNTAFIRSFRDISMQDIALVGGKNASLGEMIQHLSDSGVDVPQGFAVTTAAYWLFLEENNLTKNIEHQLEYYKKGFITLHEAGEEIRAYFLNARMPPILVEQIKATYSALCRNTGKDNITVAIRSSATAEDLPEASFAGQQESYLNVSGIGAVLVACQKCFASLFTDRAISYRNLNKIDHMKTALSVGVQMMISSDKASSGVMFSLDTETGFPDAVIINAAWGLGEGIVLGTVNPDEYLVYKPFLSDKALSPILQKTLGSKKKKVIYGDHGGTKIVDSLPEEQNTFVLSDEEILTLARSARRIEDHYSVPMDMEWAKDHQSGQLYILQARPETIQSKRSEGNIWTYKLKEEAALITQGLSIGEAIAAGEVCILNHISEAGKFPEGAVLVTSKTDPDWLPVMRKARALITDHGGRTSHAAIVSRELGLPAIIGTENATQQLKNGQPVTVSCAQGDQGFVYEGILAFDKKKLSYDEVPDTHTEVMLNMANPSTALRWWRMPADGVGLARMEFIISNHIEIHPMALLQPDKVTDEHTRMVIEKKTRHYASKEAYFIEKLSLDIGLIAASRYPKPVIVRLSDFKTNEYANLIGGAAFEPAEDNPMIGWRGASRYYDEDYRAAFALECKALKRVRDEMGFKNVIIMVPFCRTVGEGDAVLAEMAKQGLERGKNGLEVYVMAEIPANIILAEDFADRFDGFSIGSNDLTQLTLGIDRDSDKLSGLFDAKDPAVVRLVQDLIKRAHKKGAKVGFCGQAPSDDPDYARILVEAGIDSLSVTPDSFLTVKNKVAAAETELN